MLGLPLQCGSPPSQDNEWYNPETPLIEQSFHTNNNETMETSNMWQLYNEESVMDQYSSIDQQPLTLSSALQTPTHVQINGAQYRADHSFTSSKDDDDMEISLLLKDDVKLSSTSYHSPSPIEEDVLAGNYHSPPLSRDDNYHYIPSRTHYRSSSVPPREPPYSRPVYHHWTPSPPPVSTTIEKHHHTAIDMSLLLEQSPSPDTSVSWLYNRQSPNGIPSEIPLEEIPYENSPEISTSGSHLESSNENLNQEYNSFNEIYIKNHVEIFQESQLRSRLSLGTYKESILPTHTSTQQKRSQLLQADVEVATTLTKIIAAGGILTSCIPSYSFSVVLICILILVGLVLFLIVISPAYFYGNTTA